MSNAKSYWGFDGDSIGIIHGLWLYPIIIKMRTTETRKKYKSSVDPHM